MSLSSVPDAPVDTTEDRISLALAIADRVAAPGHEITRMPVREGRRLVGVLAACDCGWQIVRPTGADTVVEIAVHRVQAAGAIDSPADDAVFGVMAA
ncbi:hypothetical protein [Nocardiopsis halophila]|uniref:hypothetical protein n=1 Tax=Nocardiopsis halophila TaxID=141692 RepID=UPI0003467295|nr:hypothetical protein [Nocardiopsis halophila]